MNFKKLLLSLMCLSIFLLSALAESPAVRIKDLATLSGVRPNQLMGVGLVVGLRGTGDTNMVFTDKALTNLLTNLGTAYQKPLYKSKNVAAVMVTTELPAFVKPGQKIDIFISSVGDATSLKNGTLLMTPLKGADGKVYAVAQGPVIFGGREIKGGAKHTETVCKLVEGAIVEKEVPTEIIAKNSIFLLLNKADFTTATRIAASLERGGFSGSKAVDPCTVEVPLTGEDKENIVKFVSTIEDFLVVPDSVAKVVINERTGTVVIGENVRLAPVAVSHGDIEIKIEGGVSGSMTEAGQGLEGELLGADNTTDQGGNAQDFTVADNADNVDNIAGGAGTQKTETKDRIIKLIHLKEGASLSSLVKALNSVGTSPQDLVAIIQALKEAGSLTAEVEVI